VLPGDIDVRPSSFAVAGVTPSSRGALLALKLALQQNLWVKDHREG
jgi:hypothetical protein